MTLPAFRRPLLAAAALLLTSLTAAAYEGIVLPYKEVVVSSPVQSTIVEVLHKEGDQVTAGATLAQLYNRIEELDMQRTAAALEKREFDFEGSKNLYAEQIISEDEAMKGRIEMELARLQAEQAKEIFRQRTITAPINGMVVEQMREIGEAVTAAEPMFRLVDIDRVYVQIYVQVDEAYTLKLGDTLEVRCRAADRDAVYQGEVEFIDPRVDAASGLVRVKIVVDNPGHQIKPGLRAEVIPAD
ncbi:efflux RND transporter periplasmic adaptor subunit [Actomonas aquatica]|uniref:Efflux RND transporter periplasmic adaptor subunit n=1 Tax=Actomonas aquatica TaxID=2866162 RepID=A0ABZ1C3K5_9BACT|nr:efflux RND transporter periplasmic adaptor subunit [Opitutus sp. WL0086]WRQ86185.1 efflux RND transporter periplasmic adaptor subunit [Opitutus sp. WL0086]